MNYTIVQYSYIFHKIYNYQLINLSFDNILTFVFFQETVIRRIIIINVIFLGLIKQCL